LGPGGDDAEGMVLLERLSQHPKELATSTTVDSQAALRTSSLVHSFSSIPWFRRFWAIQECVLNVDVILYCEQRATTLVRLFVGFRCSRVGSSLETCAFEKIAGLWSKYNVFDEQPNMEILHQVSDFDIRNLYIQFSEHGCSGDRDRICSVYAMACNVSPTMGQDAQRR
jgi:hypothetical protein